MKEVTRAAKQADGRSRMCTNCPIRSRNKICSPEVLRACSNSFVEGFKKGVKWHREQLNIKSKK